MAIQAEQLLRDDGYHLNEKGLAFLATNFKRGLYHLLDLPQPIRRIEVNQGIGIFSVDEGAA